MQSIFDIISGKEPEKRKDPHEYEWCPFRKGYYNAYGKKEPQEESIEDNE